MFFFPPCLFFLHPSFSEMCYFLLSFVWSLADRAFDLLMKKNATFTFHRLFKLTSAVCVWYSLLSSVSASALLRPGTASLCSAGPAGGVNSPMTDPLFTFLCTYRKSRRSQAGFEAFDILSRLVPGYEQVMHRTASPGMPSVHLADMQHTAVCLFVLFLKMSFCHSVWNNPAG